MDIIKIFMALNRFVKSCWQLFLILTSRSWGRFRFTSISLRAGLTDWQSLTKLETGLQVELQMTELLALLEQTVLVTLNGLTSWLIPLTLRKLQTLLERTGLLTLDGLTSWLTLLTLQTLGQVVLEQTFNGLMSLLTLLVLQTLRLVTLLEHRGLLTFDSLVNWLTLLA